jgi:hypothetical protein
MSVMMAPDKDTAREAMLHFATAFVFLLLGLAALVWNSGRLSRADFADPRVLGGLHFLTLGWLSLSIFGALRVFSGVALGRSGFAMPLVLWIHRLWTLGVILFPTGLIFHLPLFILSGVLLIGVALVLFTIHILPALIRAQRGGLTRGYLMIALASLWGAWILGASAASLRTPLPVGGLPAGYLDAHVLLAVFGWVGATVVGVGSHLIPMFALSREPSTLAVKLALPLWAAIPILAACGAFYPGPFLPAAWMVAALASGLWLVQVVIYFRTRLRKERDPGLYLAAGATILLGAAWLTAGVIDAPVAFVGLAVVGWLTLFTLGIYHRVIPFLVWYSRFARNAGRGPLPKVKDLIDEKLGLATVVSVLSGALIWAGGLLSRNLDLTVTGSLLIFAGGVLAAAQLRTLLKGGSRP